MHTDLSLSGAVAQYGRGVGMIQATAAQIMSQFANNLKASLAQSAAPAAAVAPATAAAGAPEAPKPSSTATSAPPPPPAAKPISGFSLMARVLWEQIKRIFGRGA